MQELEKIFEEIEAEHPYKVPGNYDSYSQYNEAWSDAIYRVRARLEEFFQEKDNDGWIPVEERLPEDPKETPVFDNKPLELYLVDIGGGYPLRAFWNGKQFTDGWSILKVIAWRPLPEPYRPERSG